MSKSVEEITEDNRRSIQHVEHERNKDRGGDDPLSSRARSGRNATLGIWFLVVVFALLMFFLFSVVFSETTVSVTQRSQDASVDSTFTAAPAGSAGESDVPYSVRSVSAEVTRQASSTGSEFRERAASGDITISNTGSNSIRLVESTRFASPAGNIYRTQSAVNVPAGGSVSADVVAAEVGADSNISSGTDFTVPGLEGAPEYEEVTGASSDISGGIETEVPIVSSSTIAEIQESVAEELENQLQTRLQSSLPASRVAFPSGTFFSTESRTENTASGATVVVDGTLQAITFSQRDLSQAIAQEADIEIDTEADVRLLDPDAFSFTLQDRENISLDSPAEITFTLSGDGTLVWEFNDTSLARDLAGVRVSEAENILEDYPEIESAEINTRPFWKRSLPTDPAEISIQSITE